MRGSECLYTVKLQTSSIYGSGLSNLNAGILLCLIDENGDSILQRIPASLTKEPNQVEAKVSVHSNSKEVLLMSLPSKGLNCRKLSPYGHVESG